MFIFCFQIALIISTAYGLPQLGSNEQSNYNNRPLDSNQNNPIPIVSQSEITGADGSFNYSYETGNGIRVDEVSYIKKSPNLQGRSGQLRDEEGNGDVQVKSGSYSYTAPDGTVISLRYVADENGFQPEGDHLPTTPPPPEFVQRLLQQAPQEEEQSNISVPKRQITDADESVNYEIDRTTDGSIVVA